ncbi:ABC transporter permease [Patescibacteria group bacterium]|nr:ABC transporter permease [Patescibacteria group bacterium]
MYFITSIKIAYIALTTHKLRSFLTILGIVIGITSVIMVFSAGEGVKSLLLGQIESWGSDMVEVEIKTPSASQTSIENATSMVMGVSITTLKEADAQAILEHPNISNVYSGNIGQAMVTYADQAKMLQLWGVSPSYIDMDASEVEEGRFFTEDENKSLARVAVIGSEIKKKFFGDQEAIGKNIKIDKNSYKVIGVMEERGDIMYMNMDEWIYMPIRTLQKLVMGVDHVMFIMGKIINMDLADATAQDLTLLMRDRHGITDPVKDDFAVITMEEAIEIYGSILGAVTLLLMAIVAVSLIVGGVGIMNIMFVSVTERTSEIGLRKAVGASEKKILSQFLWEAITLTFIGGIIGIIFGLLISLLTSIGAQSQGLDWPFIVKPTAIIISAGASIIIGLIFGIVPARRAAKMDPIMALRHER